MFLLYCCKDKCREYEFATCEYIGASCVRSGDGTQSNGARGGAPHAARWGSCPTYRWSNTTRASPVFLSAGEHGARHRSDQNWWRRPS